MLQIQGPIVGAGQAAEAQVALLAAALQFEFELERTIARVALSHLAEAHGPAAFTSTPEPTSSFASDLVKPISPALAAA